MTIKLAPNGNQINFDELRPGLFLYNGTLCFKSEYGSEAFIVESGEMFKGGTKSEKEKGLLKVQPMKPEVTLDV